MNVKINDVVLLLCDKPEIKLAKGMRGVVVAVFEKPKTAYEVEFCDEKGRTIAEIALEPTEIAPIGGKNGS